jgi:uncharacterized membrane protein
MIDTLGGLLFFELFFGLSCAAILVVSKRRRPRLGYLNVFLAFISTVIALVFGIVLGGVWRGENIFTLAFAIFLLAAIFFGSLAHGFLKERRTTRTSKYSVGRNRMSQRR